MRTGERSERIEIWSNKEIDGDISRIDERSEHDTPRRYEQRPLSRRVPLYPNRVKEIVGAKAPEEENDPEDEGGEIEDEALRFDGRCGIGGSARRILNWNGSCRSRNGIVRRRGWSREGEESTAMNSSAWLRGSKGETDENKRGEGVEPGRP